MASNRQTTCKTKKRTNVPWFIRALIKILRVFSPTEMPRNVVKNNQFVPCVRPICDLPKERATFLRDWELFRRIQSVKSFDRPAREEQGSKTGKQELRRRREWGTCIKDLTAGCVKRIRIICEIKIKWGLENRWVTTNELHNNKQQHTDDEKRL